MIELAVLVPITALMIPIIAITVHSPIGKALAKRLETGAPPNTEAELNQLRQRVTELEMKLGEQDTQVRQLQENSEFYKQLLSSREEPSRLRQTP